MNLLTNDLTLVNFFKKSTIFKTEFILTSISMSQPDISVKQWESFDVTFSKSFVLDQSF